MFFNKIEMFWKKLGNHFKMRTPTALELKSDLKQTYVSGSIRDIVRQFQLVKWNMRSCHPMWSRTWGIGMNKHSGMGFGIGLSRDQPPTVVKFVSILIHRDNIDKHHIICMLLQTRNFHFETRKHSSEKIDWNLF